MMMMSVMWMRMRKMMMCVMLLMSVLPVVSSSDAPNADTAVVLRRGLYELWMRVHLSLSRRYVKARRWAAAVWWVAWWRAWVTTAFAARCCCWRRRCCRRCCGRSCRYRWRLLRLIWRLYFISRIII